MFLQVIDTGSQAGNSYALISDSGEIILMDAGCRYKDILKAIDYRISDISGALLTHEHQDHIKSFRDFMRAGVQCYGCDELAEYIETVYGEKIKGLSEKRQEHIGSFDVTPFYLPHTTKSKETGQIIPCPNFGYLVEHEEMGKLIYATDFEYLPFRFSSLRVQHWLIECNHMDDLVDRDSGKYAHVLQGHSSLSTVKEIIRVNKTPDIRNVVLCHLSVDNADPEVMQKEIQEIAGKWVCVETAYAGMKIPLKRFPF